AQQSPKMIAHRVPLLEYLVVPNAKHSKSLTFQPSCRLLILRNSIGVLAAVEFEHYLGLVAEEINHVYTNLSLSAKLEAAKLPVLQLGPYKPFGIRHFLAESACELVGHNPSECFTGLIGVTPHPPT